MSFKDKIKKLKGQLKERHHEEQTRKEPSRFGSIFKENLPEGVKFWKCAEGRHEVDFVPFIAGENHPQVAQGDAAYSVEVYVHRDVGPGNESFVCPSWNFKQRCPICEYMDDNKPLGKEEFTKLAVKDRTVYFVWVHDTDKEEKQGLQVWEVAKFFMAAHLKELSKESPRGGGAVLWSQHTKDGKSVAWTRQGGGTHTKYFGHRFIDRKEDIPDWILDQITFCLDDIIHMKPTYDEIYEAFYGQPKREREEALDPAKSTECPEGGTIGLDWKKFDQCPDCPLWDDCQDELEKIDKKAEAEIDEGDKEPEPEKKPSRPPRRRPRR